MEDKKFAYTETEVWVWQVVNDDLVKMWPEDTFIQTASEEFWTRTCQDNIFVLVEETITTIIRRTIL